MSGARTIAERSFDGADQISFARMSGDTNPMHMDALAARRTQAGAPVAHGVHAALWALDALARTLPLGRLAGVAVSLNRFIYLGATVALRITRQTETVVTAELSTGDLTVTTMRLTLGPRASGNAQDDFLTLPPARMDCTAETPEDLSGLAGWLGPAPAAGELSAAFPALTGVIGPERVTAIALLSPLVGMACPGLHSIFASFQVELLDAVPDRPGIGFRVTAADPRFRLIRMTAGGGGLRATVSAFVRVPPASLPDMAALAGAVPPDAFAGHRVLVTGGSRGLGALSARLIATGGGSVILTHATGSADAREVAADIQAHRGQSSCAVMALDVTRDLAPQTAAIEGPVSAMLYFPTPRIGRQKTAVFTPALLAEFLHFYTAAFAELTTLLLARVPDAKLGVLFPSSTFVADRPEGLTEYAMAKAAGEILAADLARANPGLTMVADRLPRLPTDQNATVTRVETGDPVASLLPSLFAVLKR